MNPLFIDFLQAIIENIVKNGFFSMRIIMG